MTGNVFLALAQRRQLQSYDVEAIVEILAETALVLHHLLQIGIGGGNDPARPP